MLDACKDEYKPLQSQVAAIQKDNEAVDFWRGPCNAKTGFQALLSRYRDAYSRGSRRLSDREARLESGRAAAAIKAEDEVSHFQLGLVLSIKNCV